MIWRSPSREALGGKSTFPTIFLSFSSTCVDLSIQINGRLLSMKTAYGGTYFSSFENWESIKTIHRRKLHQVFRVALKDEDDFAPDKRKQSIFATIGKAIGTVKKKQILENADFSDMNEMNGTMTISAGNSNVLFKTANKKPYVWNLDFYQAKFQNRAWHIGIKWRHCQWENWCSEHFRLANRKRLWRWPV